MRSIYDYDDNSTYGKVLYKPYLMTSVAPEIVSVDWSPTKPTLNDFVEVTANISQPCDAGEVEKVLFSFKDCFNQWWTTPMTYDNTSGLWTATIPKQPYNTTVQLYITTYDKAGNKATSQTYNYTVTRPDPPAAGGVGRGREIVVCLY